MRELNFDGWWEGDVEYSCDECRKTVKFRFDDEDSAKNAKGQRNALRRKRGWVFTKVNNQFRDFCSERCRNNYIRRNTI